MSEADNKKQQAAPASAGPGERLRAAREAQGLSFDDVVHELRLESTVVAAIERDDLDSLSAPVFVKGYLRSYARLVNLPEQDVVDAWQPAEPDPEEFLTQSAPREIKTGASLSNFVLGCLLVVIVLAVLLYLLFSGGEAPQQTAATATEVADPVDAPPALSEDFVVTEAAPATLPTAEPSAAGLPASVEADAEVATDDVTEEVVLPESPPADERIELQLSFDAECWVEVSADGRRLLYGLEKSGSERRFTVEPPLRFFVGNVDAVSIKVAGADYTIPREVRTGRNTARFVLTAADIEGLQ